MSTAATSLPLAPADRRRLGRRAQLLATASVAHNTIEAVIAVSAGVAAGSVALIGFGLDSVIEVSSGLIILWQFRHSMPESRERQAMRLIAISFFALAAYVTVESVRALIGDAEPEPSPVGIGLAIASLAVTGSTGFGGVPGRPGSLSWWGGILFPTGVLLGLAAPTLYLLDIISSPQGLTPPASQVVGLVAILVGLAVVLVAQASMGASWRIGVDEHERTTLVTDGVFGWARNPVFTDMTTIAVGVSVAIPTLISLIAFVCVVAAIQIQVRAVEERYLHRLHGPAYAAYAAYAARVGRFVAGLGLRRTRATASQSTSTEPSHH